MMTIETLRKIALSFPEATEEPHFKKTSFSVKKKIFVTYDDKYNRACIKLSEIEQNIFALADKSNIYPVANKWGKQGWTLVEMDNVNFDLLTDLLTTAYCGIAPKNLVKAIKVKESA